MEGFHSSETAAADVLDPNREITLADGRRVTVRELSWRELRQLIKAITGCMDRVMSINGQGQVSLRVEQIADVVLGDVSEALVSAACGLAAGDLADLRARDYTALLAAAVDLNIHPEMVAAGKAMAARVKALSAA